ILTGGELPAMVIVDAVARLLPGAIGSPRSLEQESFTNGLLEYPQYTRPADFLGMKVPEVLLSGNHKRIEEWRRRKAVEITRRIRPDLLAGKGLEPEEPGH
nr:tRNA (guanosine(37)-N1)-methyltransferase TrmD [Bacillota bacterium]